MSPTETSPADPGLDTALPVPRPVRWSEDRRAVELLDQTLLPAQERYVRLESASEVADAIAGLKVRGAPAIGIAGAMGLALGMERALEELGPDSRALGERLEALRDRIVSTRPTGRNLAWALDRLVRAYHEAAREARAEAAGGGGEVGATVVAAVTALRSEADAVAAEDEAMCRLIGEAGLELLPPEGEGVLTHCNAGALATGGLGTALAPFYVARERGRAVRVYASETRPVLQGARLTAWELGRAGVGATVVSDLATGTLMKEGRVRMVVVGADRIAANGDTANKIGTYALAVLADHHGIPFYVAAPRSTFDASLESGREIDIEERDPSELRGLPGRETVPPEAGVWNPAFDVTPADLVTAFITDGGILRPPYQVAIRELLEETAGAEPGRGDGRPAEAVQGAREDDGGHR